MAKHATNSVGFFALTTKAYLQSLSQIRHFYNLKVAFNGKDVWVKGFTAEQIESVEVNTLPSKSVFYLKDNLLFPKDSLLPKMKVPSLLLWSAIVQALPLTSPKINHNFFGIHETIVPTIKPSKVVKDTKAILVTINTYTKKIIENIASYRLKDVKYTIINAKEILIIGTPIVSVQGQNYWLMNDFLFPNGYELEYPILNTVIKKQINPADLYYVLWYKDESYSLILKSDFSPLSISSFRLSLSAPKV